MDRFILEVGDESGFVIRSGSPPDHDGGCEIYHRGYPSGSADDPLQGGARSSARVIAEAYRRHGAELAREVRGAFATVVIDRVERTAVLAHDEFGLETLYYTQRGATLVVATHLLDVMQRIPRRALNEDFIAYYLAHGWYSGPETVYGGVYRLAPGQAIVWRNGTLRTVDVWTVPSVEPLRCSDERDYEERLRETLKRAVARTLPAGPVCCELSGGLDSTTVLATATTLGVEHLQACSFVYSQSKSADEQPWIDDALDRFPVPWCAIDGDLNRPFSALPDVFPPEPTPAILHSARQKSYSAFLAEQNIAAVLTGEGGDATFCGDEPAPFHLADLMKRGHGLSLIRAAQEMSKASAQRRGVTHGLWHYAVKPLWSRIRGAPIGGGSAPSPYLGIDLARRTRIAERSRQTWGPTMASVENTALLEQALRCGSLAARYYSADAYPASFRHPLLDRDLVALMCSIPFEVRAVPTCDRLLQRRALDAILPDSIRLRKSKTSPEEATYAGLRDGREWVAWLSDRPHVVQNGYVEAMPWMQAVRQATVGDSSGIRYFQAAASLEGWLRLLQQQPLLQEPAEGCSPLPELVAPG